MAYYIRSYTGPYPSPTLVEATQAHVESVDISRVGYDRVDGVYAHRWVRNGYRHETPLYIDYDGRIRRGSE